MGVILTPLEQYTEKQNNCSHSEVRYSINTDHEYDSVFTYVYKDCMVCGKELGKIYASELPEDKLGPLYEQAITARSST